MDGEDQSPIFRISARGKLFLAAEDAEAALVEWALKTDESIPAAWMTSHKHLAIVPRLTSLCWKDKKSF